MKRFACSIVLAFCASLCVAGTSASSESTARPAWCQPGWECLTTTEVANMTVKVLELQAENDRLKFSQRHAIGRVGGEVGMEYLLNDHQYHAYGTGWIHVGRVNFWAGFAGDAPLAGIGWGF